MITAVILVLGGVSFAGDVSAVPWDGRTAEWDSEEYAFPSEKKGEPGSETDPFIISSGGQLKLLADLVNGGDPEYNNSAVHYKLTEDILLNDTSLFNVWSKGLIPKNVWVPIGTNGIPFKANFDGDGRTIKGVFIDNDSSIRGQGLFGCLSGSVKDLGLEESIIRSVREVGGIAGFVEGGSITGCHNAAEISGISNVGGIAGYVEGGSVTGCHNTGVVSGISDAGGIVGRMIYSGPIPTGIVDQCRNSGMITGSNHVGGIAGHVQGLEMTECRNDGPILGHYYAAGITGYAEGSSMTDCSNSGPISGYDQMGGIAGIIQNFSTAVRCTNTGEVSGSVFAGGIAGALSTGSSIEDCFNAGGVSGAAVVGGIAGSVQNPLNSASNDRNTIVNCHNAGEITVKAGNSEGGRNIGGIAGSAHSYADIENCSNSGNVTGTENVGGIAGHLTSNKEKADSYTTVANCYNSAAVLGSIKIGGIIGCITEDAGAEYSYYLKESGGINDGSDAVGSDPLYSGLFSFDHTGTVGVIPGLTSSSLKDALNEWIDQHGNAGHSSWTGVPFPLPEVLDATGADHGDIWDGVTASPFTSSSFSGSGTVNDPYLIETPEQMAYLAYLVNGDINASVFNNSGIYYKLTNDISLNDTHDWTSWSTVPPLNEWVPIGTNGLPFKANFDGSGRAVRGIYIDGPTLDSQGLFGYVSGGTIKDLNVEQSHINAKNGVGGIAGFVETGSILNCSNSGAISGASFVGGITGDARDAEIIGCHNSGTISAAVFAGGIAGRSDDTNITDCSNAAPVTANDNAGGILGIGGTAAAVSGCQNTADISGSIGYAGGIVSQTAGTVNGCINAGKVASVSSGAGGIAGALAGADGKIADCINMGTVTCANDAVGGTGGIVGSAVLGTIADCLNFGDVLGTNDNKVIAGGIAGILSMGAIMNCSNFGDVYGYGANADPETPSGIGGTVGAIMIGGDVLNSYNTGNVVGAGDNVGGMIGYSSGGIILNGYNTGAISGRNNIGGIVGRTNGVVSEITNCYNTGSVSGNTADSENLGGITGWSTGIVTNCYNAGIVSGNKNVGGIAGTMSGESITNCYNSGIIINTNGYADDAGGIVGLINSGTVDHGYSLRVSGGINNDLKPIGASTGGSAQDLYHFDDTGAIDGTLSFTGFTVVTDVMFALNCFVWNEISGGNTDLLYFAEADDPEIMYAFTTSSYHRTEFVNGTETFPATLTIDGGKIITEPVPTPPSYMHTFNGWYDDDRKWTLDTDTVWDDITLYADWNDPEEYTIYYGGMTGNGKIYVKIDGGSEKEFSADETVYSGMTVEFRADPAPNNVFSRWTGLTTLKDRTDEIIVREDMTVGAIFLDLDQGLYMIYHGGQSGEGYLMITIEDGDYVFDKDVVVSKNTVISFGAFPDDGFVFSRWTGLTTLKDRTDDITVTDDMTVGAIFLNGGSASVTITPGASDNGTVYLTIYGVTYEFDAPVTVEKGIEATFAAISDDNYYFSHWTGSPEGTEEDDPLVFNVTEDVEINAVFTGFPMFVTVVSEGGATFRYTTDKGGVWNIFMIDSSGEYVIQVAYGAALEVEAVVGERQVFKWDDGLGRASGNKIAFIVHEDETITGSFYILSGKGESGVWMILFLAILAVVIGLLIWAFLLSNPVTKVMITYAGRPVKDAVVTYSVGGGEAKEARTDNNGGLKIEAPGGSEVVISSVSIGGEGVTEKMPVSFFVEKNRTIDLYGKT